MTLPRPSPGRIERASPAGEVPGALQPAGSAAFVGREPELALLRVSLEETLWGRGRVVLLIGEPGIGKTRLAQELAAHARLRGVLVLSGRCHDDEGAPPYWPWTQAIRALLSQQPPAEIEADLGAGAAAVGRVMAAVREYLRDLAETSPLGPESERFRFFDSLTEFLKRTAKRRPIVLVLDDLHWADADSLGLLVFLARDVTEARVLVIGTLRDAEAAESKRVRSALAELSRERSVERLTLGGLSRPETARFVELATGRVPSDRLVARVHEATQGNPLFLGELVRLLVNRENGSVESTPLSRLELPHGLAPLIDRRLDQLSVRCRQVLAAASVIGRQFTLDVLAAASGLDSVAVLQALDEAGAARVVHEVADTVGRYAFSHAIVHESLRTTVPPLDRMRLHARVAEVLDGRSTDADVAEVAHHLLEAAPLGLADRAVEYAVRAGAQALAALANETAAAHYRVALQALDLVGPREAQRCELLLALGEALRRSGDAADARATFLGAAEIARRLRVPEALARAALGYGGLWSEAGAVDDGLVGLLREALAALDDAHAEWRPKLLSRLALELYLGDEGPRLSAEAVEAARQLGEPTALLSALHSRHATLLSPETLPERLALADEIVRIAGDIGDTELALQGHYWRVTDRLELGDLPAADEDLRAYARLAETLRQPLYLSRSAFREGMRALLEGRFDEAERLAEQGLARGQRARNQTTTLLFGVQLWSLRREQGRLREVEAALRAVIAEYPAFVAWRCALLYLQVELGRVEEARAGFDALAADGFAALPRDSFWLIGMTLLAEVCAAVEDVPRAITLYEALHPFADRHVVVGRAAAAYYGAVARPLGLLAATMGRRDAAREHFESALTAHARIGARPWLAHTQRDFAGMLLRAGGAADRGRAVELLGLATATARELGMTRLLERAELLRSPALDGGPRRPSPNVFRNESDSWALGYEDRVVRLRDSKGIRYIAHLLRYRGQLVHVAEVMAAGELPPGPPAPDPREGSACPEQLRVARPRGTGPVLDTRARAAYGARLAELETELAEAERWRDDERATRLREERDRIGEELAAAYGLGGRARRTGDPVERARKAVTNRIRESLGRIEAVHPALGRHLRGAIKTGTFCGYTPERDTRWQIS